MLNIGLITDTEIIHITKKFYKSNNIKIQSNVILGKLFDGVLYNLERGNLFESNLLNHNNKINDKVVR